MDFKISPLCHNSKGDLDRAGEMLVDAGKKIKAQQEIIIAQSIALILSAGIMFTLIIKLLERG